MNADQFAGAEPGLDGTVSAPAPHMELTRDGSYRHPADPGEPSTGQPRLSVTDQEAAILGVIVRNLSVVEIGTGLGVSTRALAAKARKVYTIDVDEWVQETIWPKLPGNVIPSPFLPVGQLFDVCFIDGDHSTEATATDIAWAVQNARVVLLHDVNYPSVRKAMDEHWFIIPTTHGIGVRYARS